MAVVRLVVLLLLAIGARAGIQFRTRPMTGEKLPRGKAACEIRLQVDDAVYVTLHRDRVDVRNVTGGDARDEGSACSAPLPEAEVEAFHFQVKAKRNEIRLAEPPSSRNGFRAVVFIRDSAPGPGEYVFRVTWKTPPPAPPPGMSFNNAAHSSGRGHGEATLDDDPPVVLTKASVDYDTAGHVFVVFDTQGGEPVSFGGAVMSLDGAVMKADAAADARFQRLRGPMYLYFDDKRRVFKIDLNATDGQRRLKLHWESGK